MHTYCAQMVSQIVRIAFLLGSRSFLATVQAQPDEAVMTTVCSASDLVGYDYKVEPQAGLSLHWNVSPFDDIFFKAVSTDFAVGWVAIGFSSDGNMIGSDAVVGSVEGVLEYDLGSKALPVQPPSSPLEASIRLFSDNEQEITSTVFEKAEGVTSLSFTRPITPEVAGKQNLLAGADSLAIMLWAAGSDDSFGYHFVGRGAFTVDLVCSEGQPVVEGDQPGPEVEGTESGSAVPLLTETPSVSPDIFFSVSPSAAPLSPFTSELADSNASSGGLPRLPKGGGSFAVNFARTAVSFFFAVGVLFGSTVL